MNTILTNLGHLDAALRATWTASGALRAVAIAGVLLLAAVWMWSRTTRRPVKPVLIWLGTNMALVFNAEGTWTILTKRLHQTVGFSVLVFAVFEFALLRAMSLAAERYHTTCERDNDGALVKAGHPGKAIYVVWFIALSSGFIVATNAATWTERWLRMVLPVTVVLLWWATLTAEGQSKQRGKFAYSPTRLAERWGWLVPDEDPDWQRMARQRRLRALVAHGYRLRAGTPGGWLWEWRLIRVARVVDEDTLRAAEAQVARLAGIKVRFRGGRVQTDSRTATDGGPDVDTPLAIGDLTQPAIGPVSPTVMAVAIAPDSRTDIGPTGRPTQDPTAAPTADSTRRPTADPTASPSLKVVPVSEATVKRIAAARRRWPTKTQPEIAAAVKVSPRTVERAWRLTTPDQPKTNGTPVPELTTT